MDDKVVYLKVTNNCQLRCKHCYNDFMHNKDDMSLITLQKSIKYINELAEILPDNNIDCQLHGGEPMMYEYLDALYYWLQAQTMQFKNIHWGITTNLVYKLTPIEIAIFKLMKPYRDSNETMIQTSWDYNIRFQNPNQLALWTNNVYTLLEHDIKVQPTICLTNELITNYTGEKLILYMINLGVDRINFERITNTGRAANGSLRPNNESLDKWLLDCYKMYEYYRDKITIGLFESVEKSLNHEYLGCRARKCMQNVITINPDGSVGGCPNTAYSPIGNLDYNDPKKTTIWIQKENTRDNQCYTCEYFQYCNGDCFQLTWDNTGCPGMKSIYQYLLTKEQK